MSTNPRGKGGAPRGSSKNRKNKTTTFILNGDETDGAGSIGRTADIASEITMNSGSGIVRPSSSISSTPAPQENMDMSPLLVASEEKENDSNCCKGATYLLREWRAPFFVLAFGCIAVCITLIILDSIKLHKRMTTIRTSNIALNAGQAGLDSTSGCLGRRFVLPLNIPVPESFETLETDVKKYHPKLESYVTKAKQLLTSGDCLGCLDQLSTLQAKLASIARDPSKDPSTFAYTWQLAIGLAESRGLLHLSEDTPVTSLRVYEGIAADLQCIPTTRNLIQNLLDYRSIPQTLTCPDFGVLITGAPVISPPTAYTVSLAKTVTALSQWWITDTLGPTKTDSYAPLAVRFTLYGIILLVAIVGAVLLMKMIKRRLGTEEMRMTMGQDFCTFREWGRIAMAKATVQLLDYYCWRVGNLEAVDPNISKKFSSGGSSEQQQQQQPPMAITAANSMQDGYNNGDIMQGGELLSPLEGNAPGQQRQTPMLDQVLTEDITPEYLPRQRGIRDRLIRMYEEEYNVLESATQIQLLMHQAVHPMLLLRPFVPEYLRREQNLKASDLVNLGTSVSTRDSGIVMREGLDEGDGAYLYISFKQYNSGSAVDRVVQHYTDRRVRYSETTEDRERHHRAQQGVCGGPSDVANKDPSAGATSVVVVDPDDPNHTAPCGGRLVESWEDDQHPLPYPLSCIGAGINYITQCMRVASGIYGGEVVQVCSDGALIQFRDAISIKHDSEQHFGNGAPLPDMIFSDYASSPLMRDRPSEGPWAVMCPEERATRAALHVQERLSNYMSLYEDILIPNDLLRCPMAVVSESDCLRGSVTFHVSKHYCVLSKCIPLLFPLESVAFVYGANIVLTKSVHDRIDAIAIARPIHHLDEEDLNYYFFKGSRAEGKGIVDDDMASLTHIHTSATVTASLSGGEDERAGSPRYKKKKKASEKEERAALSTASTRQSFTISGTIFELHSLKPLDTSSQAHKFYVEEETRTRARREHWRIIWNIYEEIVRNRRQFHQFQNRTDQRNNRTHDSNDLADVNFMALEPALTTQSKKSASRASRRASEASPSQHDVMSQASSFSQTASERFQRRRTEQEETTIAIMTDRLKECRKELNSLKDLYGVQREESISYNKVYEDVVSMLLALGIFDEMQQ